MHIVVDNRKRTRQKRKCDVQVIINAIYRCNIRMTKNEFCVREAKATLVNTLLHSDHIELSSAI
jgi:hypothetical protein